MQPPFWDTGIYKAQVYRMQINKIFSYLSQIKYARVQYTCGITYGEIYSYFGKIVFQKWAAERMARNRFKKCLIQVSSTSTSIHDKGMKHGQRSEPCCILAGIFRDNSSKNGLSSVSRDSTYSSFIEISPQNRGSITEPSIIE